MTSPATPNEPVLPPPRSTGSALGAYAVVAMILGIAAAVLWRLIVQLPAYVVQPDGSAAVTERALTEFFAADAWYVVLGAAVGLALGIATWRRFADIGWLCALVASGLGLLAGIVCWQLGQLIGGAPFDERLAAAQPGDVVPISLALRSPSALAVWAFAAITPILLGSALGPDDEAAARPRRTRSGPAIDPGATQREVVDERGVRVEDASPQ